MPHLSLKSPCQVSHLRITRGQTRAEQLNSSLEAKLRFEYHPGLKKYIGGGRGALRNIHLGPFVKNVKDPHYTFLCGFGQTTCCKQWVLTQGVISYIFSRGHFIHFLFLVGSLGYVRGVLHTFNLPVRSWPYFFAAGGNVTETSRIRKT